MQSKLLTRYTEAHAFMQHVQKTGNNKFYIETNLKDKEFTVHWGTV